MGGGTGFNVVFPREQPRIGVESADVADQMRIQRPPLAPIPHMSTKATAIAMLGVAAVVMAPFVGGLMPALVVLLMEGPADRELKLSGGFLTGAGWIRFGRIASYIAIGITAVVLMALAIYGLVSLSAEQSPQLDSDVY